VILFVIVYWESKGEIAVGDQTHGGLNAADWQSPGVVFGRLLLYILNICLVLDTWPLLSLDRLGVECQDDLLNLRILGRHLPVAVVKLALRIYVD
jgi:hypothetical protein